MKALGTLVLALTAVGCAPAAGEQLVPLTDAATKDAQPEKVDYAWQLYAAIAAMNARERDQD